MNYKSELSKSESSETIVAFGDTIIDSLYELLCWVYRNKVL